MPVLTCVNSQITIYTRFNVRKKPYKLMLG